jgi:hypothetical protein
MLGTGRASADLEQTLKSACQGRIRTLFVPVNSQRWGQYDRQLEQLIVHEKPQPGDRDLLDLAAMETLAHSGTVYVTPRDQMPDGGEVAALLRY